MRSTITLYFVSSFVRKVPYPRISPIGLHLAEKNWIEFWMPMTMTTTTTTTTNVARLNYSPWQKFCRGQKRKRINIFLTRALNKNGPPDIRTYHKGCKWHGLGGVCCIPWGRWPMHGGARAYPQLRGPRFLCPALGTMPWWFVVKFIIYTNFTKIIF